MTGLDYRAGAGHRNNQVKHALVRNKGFVDHTPRKGLIYFIGFGCAVFWGVGTQFIGTRIAPYWYVANGVSVGEILFLAVLILLLWDKVWRSRFQSALYQMRSFVIILLLLTTMLLTSVAVNTPLYGGEIQDVFACLRLIYFLLIAVFVHAYVKQYGLPSIILPFIIGLSLIAVDQLNYAFSSPDAILLAGGLPLVRDPNVVGAVLGYGVLFCSLALLHGGRNIYGLAASFFVIASVFTFSKGAWIMVFIGCVACIAAMKIDKGVTSRSNKRFYFLLYVVALMLPYLMYDNYEILERAVTFKLETTEANASVDDRFNLALVGLYAMAEHPLLGLGYRNYDVVGNQYPQLIIPNSGNANNAFLQIGAVGGVISFVLIVGLFVYPFKLLSQVIPLNTWLGKVYLGAAFLVMFIFAVVQIQLIAQPVFWVFIGLVSGWHSILRANRTASLCRTT